MEPAIQPATTSPLNPGRGTELLYALCKAAARLQQVAHSEAEILETFANQIARLGLFGAVCLLDTDSRYLILQNLTHPDKIFSRLSRLTTLDWKGIKFRADHIDTFRQVITHQKPVFTSDYRANIKQLILPKTQDSTARMLNALTPHPCITVPLPGEDCVKGLVSIYGADLTPADVPAITAYADHLSVALDNARLFASVQESERKSRSISEDVLDGSAAALLILNAEGDVVWANQAFGRYFGLKRAMIVGLSAEELVNRHLKFVFETPKAFAREILKAYKDNVFTKNFECHVLPAKDRQERWLEYRSYPVRSGLYAGGRIDHYYGITKRKQIEETQQQRGLQLAMLNNIGKNIAAVTELDEVLTRAVQLVQENFGYHHVAVFTLEPEQKTMWMRAKAGSYAQLFPPNHRLQLNEGMVGWVMKHKETLLVGNVHTEVSYLNPFPNEVKMVTKSELSVPITVKGSVIGVLDVQSPKQNAFNRNDVVVLQTLADQLAVGIENARLYQAIKQELAERKRAERALRSRNRDLTLLNRIVAESAVSRDAEDILETTCRELCLAFDLPQAVTVLFNQKDLTGIVAGKYQIDGRPPIPTEPFIIKTDPLCERLLQDKGPLAISNLKNDPELHAASLPFYQQDIASTLLIPLVIKEAIDGYIRLDSTIPGRFSPHEVNLAWGIADQVAGTLTRIYLTQTQRRFSTAIDQASESIIITDTQGNIEYVNPAFSRISGYTSQEVFGTKPTVLAPSECTADFLHKLWSTITAGEVWHGRVTSHKKDGALFTEDVTVTPVRDPSGNIANYICIQRDVTRELLLEEQHRQGQKMEAVGRLAAGIAHDFNNLLTAINGFAELTQRQLAPEAPQQKYIDNILRSGRNAADLVGQLLTFSRKQVITPQLINLNQTVAEMEKMLHRIIGENINLKTTMAPNLWSVIVDPTQMQQVIINLSVNARDAMPNGGTLTIETHNVVLDETYLAKHLDAQLGPNVVLSISDTGSGISKETIAHIFEPFFTTKELGKGTGLGLATAFGIIKQSKGDIWVYSEEGVGSTFKIYLPAISETAAEEAISGNNQEIPLGTETILLVEDDDNVRRLVKGLLSEQGYTLVEGANGEEALQIASQYKNTIHMLLTDVIMPGIDGRTLANTLNGIIPNLKILFMSGYNDNMIAHHGVLDPDVNFLAKPFTSRALAQKVRTVLDED